MEYNIHIVSVDFHNQTHVQDLMNQLIAYSADEMGGGKALDVETAGKSVLLLGNKPYAFSFLAYDGSQAIGFANCFESVATFSGACAANIHDLSVIKSHRGLGIGRALLTAIETYAAERDYTKLTLEVLEGNAPANALYQTFGFDAYELDPKVGTAKFLQKILNAK